MMSYPNMNPAQSTSDQSTASLPIGISEEKRRLIIRRDELRARLAAIKRDYQRGLSADSEERAIELENAEALAEIARVLNVELTQVESQLAEI